VVLKINSRVGGFSRWWFVFGGGFKWLCVAVFVVVVPVAVVVVFLCGCVCGGGSGGGVTVS